MPVLREFTDLWRVKRRIDLHGAEHNAHELEVTIDLSLMSRQFVDAALDSLEGLNVAEVIEFGLPLEEVSPVLQRKTFDCEPKLERRIREGCGVLATGAYR